MDQLTLCSAVCSYRHVLLSFSVAVPAQAYCSLACVSRDQMGGGGAHGLVLEALGITSESDRDNPPPLEDCSDEDSDGDRRDGDRSDGDSSYSHSDTVIVDGDAPDST